MSIERCLFWAMCIKFKTLWNDDQNPKREFVVFIYKIKYNASNKYGENLRLIKELWGLGGIFCGVIFILTFLPC